MKRTLLILLSVIASFSAAAYGPAPHHGHRACHHGGFAAGVIGGAFVGGYIHHAIRPYRSVVSVSAPVVVAPAPVVVQPAPVVVQPAPVVAPVPQPVYEERQVWVPGGYVDQVQPDGSVRRVWQPGHYETRKVQIR